MCSCGRYPVPGEQVRLVRGVEGGHGFSGVQRCGVGWVCPVCRLHISNVRQAEVTHGVERALEHGFYVTLVTVTAYHTRDDDLGELWPRFRKAVSQMLSTRRGRAWREAVGYIGRITGNEVTWGEASGWHPHQHLLFITRHPISEPSLWRLWEATAALRELVVNRGAFDVKRVDGGRLTTSHVARYVTKPGWGVAAELAASGEKLAMTGRYSPFELLAEVERSGDADLADRFREYVEASQGVALLRWSQGLRAALGVTTESVSDEEAANETEADTTVVYVFERSEWLDVVAAGARLELLRVADRDGVRGVVGLVARCRRARPSDPERVLA